MFYRPINKAVLFCCLAILVSCCSSVSGEAIDQAACCRVLIVTGQDSHNWRQTTPVLRELLEQDQRLQCDVLEDLSEFGKTDLTPYRVIVAHFKNADPKLPGRRAFDNLRQFVKQGGGLVLVHFACGAFEEFKKEYAELAGRIWFGITPPPGRRHHDPRGPFIVNITDQSHPITKGMVDFNTDDELYTCLEGDAPIKVIAAAKSNVDSRSYPVAFVVEYGNGRVFNCTLGHDVRALKTKAVGELYRRGCAWAACLSPTATDARTVKE